MLLLKALIISYIVFNESRSECNLTKSAVAHTIANRIDVSWHYVLSPYQFSLSFPKTIYLLDLKAIPSCLKYGTIATFRIFINHEFNKAWYFKSKTKHAVKWAVKRKLLLTTKNIKFYRR